MRVLIVDDSALMRTILRDFFERHAVEIAGEASNGRQAIEKAAQLRPDLVTMDIDMPMMNGIEATAEIMKNSPVPIVVFSGDVTDEVSFTAFKAGAADVIAKPDLDCFYNGEFTASLINRFKAVVKPGSGGVSGAVRRQSGEALPRPGTVDAVVLGASTGGPVAVKTVLAALPASFPVGVALVQHIEARFAEGYAKWLDNECALSVRLARGDDHFEPGTVIVAPGDRHLVMIGKTLAIDDGPKVGSHRPAVDRLFESAAATLGDRLVGVLLTGMGRDGADGCVAIRDNGGFTIVQDQATSFIYGMPKAAAEAGGASVVRPLGEIAGLLEEVTRRG